MTSSMVEEDIDLTVLFDFEIEPTCQYCADYENECGKPAEYIAWLEPCGCGDVFLCKEHKDEQVGHAPGICWNCAKTVVSINARPI